MVVAFRHLGSHNPIIGFLQAAYVNEKIEYWLLFVKIRLISTSLVYICMKELLFLYEIFHINVKQ